MLYGKITIYTWPWGDCNLTLPGVEEDGPSLWWIRRLTKWCAAFTSTGVAGNVDGLLSTSLSVNFDSESTFSQLFLQLLRRCSSYFPNLTLLPHFLMQETTKSWTSDMSRWDGGWMVALLRVWSLQQGQFSDLVDCMAVQQHVQQMIWSHESSTGLWTTSMQTGQVASWL